MFKIGDIIKLVPGAIYLNNNKDVPESLLNIKLFIREVKENSCIIARAKNGPILGEVENDNLILIDGNESRIKPYIIQIPTENLPLYHSPNKNSGIIKRLNRFALFTIIDEKNGFGKIKVGAGWIDLSKINRL